MNKRVFSFLLLSFFVGLARPAITWAEEETVAMQLDYWQELFTANIKRYMYQGFMSFPQAVDAVYWENILDDYENEIKRTAFEITVEECKKNKNVALDKDSEELKNLYFINSLLVDNDRELLTAVKQVKDLKQSIRGIGDEIFLLHEMLEGYSVDREQELYSNKQREFDDEINWLSNINYRLQCGLYVIDEIHNKALQAAQELDRLTERFLNLQIQLNALAGEQDSEMREDQDDEDVLIQCPICLGEFDRVDLVICEHSHGRHYVGCRECIKILFGRSHSHECPMCRRLIDRAGHIVHG